jgi:hypothetical protein
MGEGLNSAAESAASANTFSAWSGAIGAAASIASSGISLYFGNKTAKYQARLAKAQARIQANELAAESVANEQTAQRLSQAFGAQDYETRRQQQSYLEDMALSAAIRGGAMEGSNSFLIAEQAREFERSNAYAELANARQQANYMAAAQQGLDNARNALRIGNIEARNIRSTARANLATGIMNIAGSALSGASSIYGNYAMNDLQIQAAKIK